MDVRTKDSINFSMTASFLDQTSTVKLVQSISPSNYQKAADNIFDMPDEDFDFDEMDEYFDSTQPKILEIKARLNPPKETPLKIELCKDKLPYYTLNDLSDDEPVIPKNLLLREKRVMVNPKIFDILKK